MEFTHLHTHSHYSLLDGLGKIDELLDAVSEMGMDSLALTDHGVMYGLVEFFQKAKKKKIKPILGSELYIAPRTRFDKQSGIDNKNYHLVLLVKNQEGYQNLVKLVTQAHLEGFYYKPRIDKDLLKKHSKGLIGLSACLAGEIPKAIINNSRKEKAEKIALEYQKIFGKDNFYLELQYHPNFPEQSQVNDALIKIAKANNLPLVATNDIHYVKSEDAKAQDVLMSIQTDKKVDDERRLTMKDEDFSLRPPEKMIEIFKDTPEAIENTQKIKEMCNFEFKLGKIQLPYFEVPNGKTSDQYLRESCKKGIKERYETEGQSIYQRLDHELEVIKKTGFASYFLIVQDFVVWAKKQGIVVGPGRGSAAGSLVAYLLHITDVDPLKYDLIFERFLNPERISMPDIDLDFADDRRDEVIDYVSQKYGQERVAQIITFGTMAARAAVRDVGRALNYSYNFCDQIAKMIPFGSSLDKALEQSSELKESYDSDNNTQYLIDMAKKLEGCVRHASTHAAAVVITRDKLDNLIPQQHPTQNDQSIVTQYEMHGIEDLGLLKMDFLGLRTLTVIQNTLNRVEKIHQKEIDLLNMPLDDQKTFELLRQGNTTAVFQFESGGMKRNLKDLKPTQFEDIVAMVALYRPGPMEFIPEFISRKHGLKEVEYLHPKLEPILSNTYGICIYQEQLMKIAQNLAGFTLPEADVLRKAVGKKNKKLLDEQKEKMLSGMVDNGINKQTAKQIWHTIEPFARYGFNAAHATCYALVGYRTAYLKTHYPTEFMAASMTSEQNEIERVAFLVEECRQMDMEVLPPNINESEQDFTESGEKVIRFGLNAVKNVGHNVVESIVQARKANGPFKNIADFIERVDSKDLNKKSLESLIKCGAMDAFGERNQLLASMEQMLSFARETQKAKQSGQVSLFGGDNGAVQLNTPSFKLADATPADNKDYLSWEKELLGLYVSEHPLRYHKANLNPSTIPIEDISREQSNRNIMVGGVVNKIKKITTKNGDPMLFAEIEDLTGTLEIVVFPKVLERTVTAWQEEKIVNISGRISSRDESLKILCDDVKVIA